MNLRNGEACFYGQDEGRGVRLVFADDRPVRFPAGLCTKFSCGLNRADDFLTFGANGRRMMNMRKEEITLSQLSGRWEAAVRYQVKPTTYGIYRTMIEKHIVPGLGFYRVEELDNRILEKYLQEKQEQQLSWNTLRLIVFILKGVLRMGEEWGIRTGERLHYYIPQYKKPYMRVFRVSA